MSRKLIIAGYNNFNLGDDLMFASIINRTSYDDYFLYGPEVKPHFVEKDVNFIKNGRLEVLRWKMGAHFALVGGSLFMGDNEINLRRFDWKIQLFKRNKLLGGKNFVMGANLGPFKDKKKYLSKLREVTNLVDYWHVRDQFSLELLDEINVKNKKIIPDLVMSMDLTPYQVKKTAKIVAISVTRVEKDGNQRVRQVDFEDEICELCKNFIKAGYNISLLSFEDSNDISIALSIKNRINSEKVSIEPYQGKNIIMKIAESEFLVSTRFHCMIIGALLSKKQVIYEYSEKTSNFAKRYGFEVFKITGNAKGKDFFDTSFDANDRQLAKLAIDSMGDNHEY